MSDNGTASDASQESQAARVHKFAHDVRNCLYVIRTATHLLKAGHDSPEELQEILDQIAQSERDASRMVGEFVEATLKGAPAGSAAAPK